MEANEIAGLLDGLIAGWENEVVEFKEPTNDYSTDLIGKYFSALANEANLRNEAAGWLVFGVNDKSRKVTGTSYRPGADHLESLKRQIAQNTEPQSTFRVLHDFHHQDGRVVLMEIPPAPRGMPISWNGHYHGRAGECLVALALDKIDEIRGQTLAVDWSAVVVPEAGFEDLDERALRRAKESFGRKHANRVDSDELADWSTAEFTDRAKLTQGGQITRTALLLLGRPESAWRLSPNPAQLTWNLEGTERAYEHFGPPFFLNTTELFRRIRNIQLRLLPDDQLLPEEVSKYDQRTVLEALHNCLAHQDYALGGRVVVTERPDQLVFESEGAFFDGAPVDYLSGARVPRRYRNPFLVQAMSELNMIDTMGYGIRTMNDRQAKRYLPLPDFDLSDPQAVKLTIYGGVVDPAYTRLLLQATDLPFATVLALDRVQKKLPIPDEEVRRLKRAKLVEGRKPNLYVAAGVAAATDQKAEYIRTRAQDDTHYAKLITDFLEKFGSASRRDINQLLWDKLSDSLNDRQKANKINNLLTKLNRRGVIRNSGSKRNSAWILDVGEIGSVERPTRSE
ncbi:MAG: putative DNA binding domain-containing protein [Candidatus Nanopelagicales bacterium]|nr:putative DNA binding domain-containing protein [Candidatus Nanopelagicales bacterium]